MVVVTIIGIFVVILFFGYLVVNGRRNSDPLNRKCAAEICEYLVENPQISVARIREIFRANARYRGQANHIISMVPALLIKAGFPRDAAMSVVPILREAVENIPR